MKDPVWTVLFICSVDVLVSQFDFSPKEYPLRMPQPTPTQMKGDYDITRVCVNVAFPPLLEEFIPVTLSPSPTPNSMTLLRRTSVLFDRLKKSFTSSFWNSRKETECLSASTLSPLLLRALLGNCVTRTSLLELKGCHCEFIIQHISCFIQIR